MNKFKQFIVLLLITCSLGFYSCSKDSNDDGIEWKSSMIMDVSQSGTLSNLIPTNKRDLINQLKLVGYINSEDFKVLKDMSTNGNLSSLDLSDANINDLKIPTAAFRDCSKLKEIVLPNNITGINDWAFGGCSNLTSIKLSSKISFIGNAAFCGCTKINTISLPDNITEINTSTFSECENLTSIIIPSKVTTIKYQAFCKCSNLSSITIPSNVELIEKNAFQDCTSMSKVIFDYGTSNLQIGEDYYYNSVFLNCPLEEIVLSRNLKGTNIMQYPTTALFNDIAELKKVTISGYNINVEPLAFSYCKNIKNVVIGNGVKKIGNGAFSQSTISEITLGNTIENIDDSAFLNCNIITLHIPSSVKKIGDAAFSESLKLSNLYVESTTPPTIMGNTFNSIITNNSCTLHIPRGSKNEYMKNQYWNRFSNIIEY